MFCLDLSSSKGTVSSFSLLHTREYTRDSLSDTSIGERDRCTEEREREVISGEGHLISCYWVLLKGSDNAQALYIVESGNTSSLAISGQEPSVWAVWTLGISCSCSLLHHFNGLHWEELVGLFYFLSTWCWLCNLLTKHWREWSWIKSIVLLVIWVGSGSTSLACKLISVHRAICVFNRDLSNYQVTGV